MNHIFVSYCFCREQGQREPHQRGQNSERRERVDDVNARADRIDDAKEQTEAVLYLDDNSGDGRNDTYQPNQ